MSFLLKVVRNVAIGVVLAPVAVAAAPLMVANVVA